MSARQRLLDVALADAVADLLVHDRRHLAWRTADTVEIRVDGGVAHLRGTVPRPDARRLLREQVTSLRGVHAVWDRLADPGRPPLLVLDVGCGGGKQYAENVGVDRAVLPGVDVVADLRRGLPFRDRCLDRAFAVHVLEHLLDVVPVMNELHRVLRADGVLHVMTPDAAHVNAIADPTHLKLFCTQTFKYFCGRSPGVRPWLPLSVSSDGASVFADLAPLQDGESPADAVRLARFFD